MKNRTAGIIGAAIIFFTGLGSAQTSGSVPLRAGLTVVTAVHQENGDFESIKRITSVGTDSIDLSYSADSPAPNVGALFGGGSKSGQINHTRVRRSVRRLDLREAHEYAQAFSEVMPQLIPGTTAIGVSAAVLNELKTRGETTLTVHAPGLLGAVGGLLGSLTRGSSGNDMAKATGKLKRVETQAVKIPVLVNDQRIELPAIHARGTLGDSASEFFFLDDPENPLTLQFKVGDDTLTVVKIAFPLDAGTATASSKRASAPQIERALEKTGRAEVYGIYFDFGSAVIKEESAPVLDEIAALMAKNTSWKLDIEGHTDNIGGDAYNLDLSKRRAAAVKDALVSRYHVAAGRLATAGYGAGRPKDSNDTLEGRARNRRVELVRQ